MRDIAILAILASFIVPAFYRPWLGVLGLTVFSYLVPHGYAWGFMNSFPAYQVLFIGVIIAVAIKLLLHREWPSPPLDWRIAALVLLWIYFLFTTTHAKAPWVAWPKFYEVSKVLLPLALTWLLIDNRQKLFYLIVTIAACFGLLAVKGGYWAVMTGFSDRVYGPPNSAYHDNNHFAVAVIMNIPLLVLWLRETSDKGLRVLLMVTIALSMAAAVSSWSRGALLTLGVIALLLIWHSRRKYLAIPLLAVGIVLMFSTLPETWFSRMDTIVNYQGEGSAEKRLAAWQSGITYALQNPWTGAGFEGWRFVNLNTLGRIDWHNAYVEIMTEHGLIAFAIWFSLLFGSIISLTRLAWLASKSANLGWVKNYSIMLRASLIAYATGSLFLGLSYWDLLYHLVIISILLKKFAQKAMALEYGSETRSTVLYPKIIASDTGSPRF